jgi:hypothetical protein
VTVSRIDRTNSVCRPWFAQNTHFCGGTDFYFSDSRHPTCRSHSQYNGHVAWGVAVAHPRGTCHYVPGNVSAAYWDGCHIGFEVAGCSGSTQVFVTARIPNESR